MATDASPRVREHRLILTVYAAVSFVVLFGFNYASESRAFKSLSIFPELFVAARGKDRLIVTDYWSKRVIDVPTYGEKYALFNGFGFGLGVLIVFGIAVFVGWVAGREEEVRTRWQVATAITVYIGFPWLMAFCLYPDMASTILVSLIYLALFFAIRGIQLFNPHVLLASNATTMDGRKYDALLQLYERYQVLLLGVIGFVTATFVVGASALLQSIYSRSGPIGTKIYGAVHMPYLQAVYSYAAFGCLALGFGAVRELHLKIEELLRLTPVDSSQTTH